jgi:alanine racemase
MVPNLMQERFFSPPCNCWAEIDLDALSANARTLCRIGPALMAVMKADAYGHSTRLVAPQLIASGVSDFGAATAAEGVTLRNIVGVRANVYVMTACAPADAAIVAQSNLIPFVSTEEAVRDLSSAAESAGNSVDIHVEVDTGIGRAGVQPDEAIKFIDFARNTRRIRVTGICTHFTWGENADDAARQHAVFEDVLNRIPDEILSTLTVHAANSPAALNVPGARHAMYRPGLLLYGIAPCGGSDPIAPNGETLRPVLSLRARVLHVRDLRAGTDISYGRTYTLPAAARIATVGIGYGDGYPRRLSNIGRVLLSGGIEAPIRGRICMDQICVEIPEGIDVAAGDTVTLIGKSGESQLRCADVADAIEATPHELTTCLTSRVPRIAVSNGVEVGCSLGI